MSRLLPWLLLSLVAATGLLLLWQFVDTAKKPAVVEPPQPQVAGELPQGHLYSGITEEPNLLNPFTTISAVARGYVLGFTHDTLVDIDPANGELRGRIAEKCEEAPDGLSMTVTLREGVQFSDGAPLTPEDVLFAVEVRKTPDVVLGSVGVGLNMVDRAELLPGLPPRIHIVFERPVVDAAAIVGLHWYVVRRQWYLDRIAELAHRDGVPTPKPGERGFGALLAQLQDDPGPGTGPYAFASRDAPRPSWRRGRDLTLFRSQFSWQRRQERGCWNLGGIRLLFVTDPAAAHAMLLQRSIDWYSAPNLAGLLQGDKGLAADYRREVYDKPSLGAILVQWNTARGPLQDARVRRALAMLFDRQVIVDKVLGGVGTVAAAFGKRGRAGYPADLEAMPFDPPAARRLLRDAGFVPEDGKPLHVRLLVPAGASWFRQMAEMAAAAARQAGVELQLQELLAKELFDRIGGDDWDGALLLKNLTTDLDPYELFHSRGSLNVMHWHDSKVDELLDQQRTERDENKRSAILREVHLRVADQQPVALLVHPLAEILVNAHLQEAKPGPRGMWPERVWVPVEFQRAAP